MLRKSITFISCSLTLLFFFSCKYGNQNITANNESVISHDKYAISVTMEGKTLGLKQSNLEPQKAIISTDSILFEFWDDSSALKLNFNLFNTNILEEGTASYSIPDSNGSKQLVDLNFYNKDREVKRINKRIIFRKGTITISKITKNELNMTFDGEGSGVLEYGKTFPISGKVNVKL